MLNMENYALSNFFQVQNILHHTFGSIFTHQFNRVVNNESNPHHEGLTGFEPVDTGQNVNRIQAEDD